jgi:hypothetical protein
MVSWGMAEEMDGWGGYGGSGWVQFKSSVWLGSGFVGESSVCFYDYHSFVISSRS